MGTTASIRFYVHGLSCGGGGALTLERFLSRTPGVSQVFVNPLTRIACVRFDSRGCGPAALVEAASMAGFSVVPLQQEPERGRGAAPRGSGA